MLKTRKPPKLLGRYDAPEGMKPGRPSMKRMMKNMKKNTKILNKLFS